MPKAGYCHDCAAYVWLDDGWGCSVGHPRERVNGWYDPDTGQPMTPPWAAQAPAAAAASAPEPAAPGAIPSGPASRIDLLQAIIATLATHPGYQVRYGTDTDVIIDNRVVDGSYGTGKKKVEFEAIMKAVEPERMVYYWEILKEKGAGFSMSGFASESYSTSGRKRWGTKKELIVGPGGAVSYEWDYGKTRQMVEATAAQYGWTVKTVLRKTSAQW